jgi:putative tryptophan/tyrosine transport system substrate-binding protein
MRPKDTTNMMRRRAFIVGISSAVATAPVLWPLKGHGQQAAPVRRIGVLLVGSSEGIAPRLPAFLQALQESGFVEGRNLALQYRSAEGNYDRFPVLAADLVRLEVDAIFAFAGPRSVVAAKDATTTIPIVFAIGEDPVKIGLVDSFARPGHNVTGVTFMAEGITPKKRFELLHEFAPAAARIAVLINPSDTTSIESVIADARAAAATLGLQIEVLMAADSREIDVAFDSLAGKPIAALVVYPSLFYYERRVQLATLAAHHALPAIYFDRELAEAGGLVSYGTDFTNVYRQVGLRIGRILNGENPAAIPVMQVIKFDLVINLRTAKQLGIDVPPTLTAMADKLIE